MNLFKNLKKIINEKCRDKRIINLITILLLGIIVLIAASSFTQSSKSSISSQDFDNQNKQESSLDKISYIENYEKKIEEKLENILSRIEGVGSVKAMVTFEETVERVPAINLTKSIEATSEEDSEGGIREIKREDYTEQIVVGNKTENDEFMVIKEIKPRVKGVIIVAQGANDFKIKEKLYSAVKTVLGISVNRVEIYEGY